MSTDWKLGEHAIAVAARMNGYNNVTEGNEYEIKVIPGIFETRPFIGFTDDAGEYRECYTWRFDRMEKMNLDCIHQFMLEAACDNTMSHEEETTALSNFLYTALRFVPLDQFPALFEESVEEIEDRPHLYLEEQVNGLIRRMRGLP